MHRQSFTAHLHNQAGGSSSPNSILLWLKFPSSLSFLPTLNAWVLILVLVHKPALKVPEEVLCYAAENVVLWGWMVYYGTRLYMEYTHSSLFESSWRPCKREICLLPLEGISLRNAFKGVMTLPSSQSCAPQGTLCFWSLLHLRLLSNSSDFLLLHVLDQLTQNYSSHHHLYG